MRCVNLQGTTKPLLVKVGALCIKKEGAHFDTPSLFSHKTQNTAI